MQDALEQVQAENRERLLLGTGKPCATMTLVPAHPACWACTVEVQLSNPPLLLLEDA